jgi:tetratricopeptide (TPR) repeat protein
MAYEFFGRSFLPSVVSGVYLSQSLVALGDFDEGMRQAEECLRIADVVNNLSSQVFAGCAFGSICVARGNLSRALVSLERVHGLCQDADVLTLFLLSIAHLGYAYALSGRVAEALPLLEQAVEQAAHSGPFNPTLWFAWLGETYLLAGRPNDALTLTTDALDLCRAQKERGHEALVLRHLGGLALHGKPSDLDQAQTHYQQAIALAYELEMRPLQAHCHLGLGTLYTLTGRPEQTRSELFTAIDLYRDMEMRFWLPQAESALAEAQNLDRIFDNW